MVSIILPVYNVEKYIARSIQSVLNQTYGDFELLIIDDGTPDKSIEIVEQFTDPRIKIFHKENGGLSDTRNYGIEKASGEYIYFMDSDDWIEPDLLKNCIKAIKNDELDLVIFGYIQDNETKDGKIVNSTKVVPPKAHYIKNKDRLQLTIKLIGILGYAWNKIYKKDFLIKNNLKFDKGISLVEDILFNSRVYEFTNELVFLDKAYYHYLNRPVKTLIKRFYPNVFELKLMKLDALNRFMDAWKVQNKNKNEILAISLIHGIRYCIHNLFVFKNNYGLNTKMNYVKMMVTHPETIRLINHYKPESLTDRGYLFLIRFKMYRTISLISLIVKRYAH